MSQLFLRGIRSVILEMGECVYFCAMYTWALASKDGTLWFRHFSAIYGFTRLPAADKDTDFSYLLVPRCLSLARY